MPLFDKSDLLKSEGEDCSSPTAEASPPAGGLQLSLLSMWRYYIKSPLSDASVLGVHRDIYAATPHFPLDFRIRIYYNIRMKKKPSEKSRSRAEILAEIAALPPSVQGTISSYRCPRKNGPPAVYHNLQYTRGGKNHSFSIPVDKVSEFKAAAAAGRKLRDLVFELSLADANEIASSESPLKKSSRSSS